MNLTLTRTDLLSDRTLGILSTANRKLCDTLELPLTADAQHPKCAIPAGTYALRITYSPRFKTMLPILINIPGRKGIRIHAGNTPKDSSGCILVGERNAKSLMRSQHTLSELLKLLPTNETHTITIA